MNYFFIVDRIDLLRFFNLNYKMTQIFEGLKLMVVGMSIVYVFLILLMVSIIISSKIFKTAEQATAPVGPDKEEDTNELITVISSAIAVYRAKKQK